MSGTKAGGKKAAETNKKLFGEDFYSNIGSVGGKKGTTGGFWHAKYVKGDDNFAKVQGAVGGRKGKQAK